MWRLPLLPHCEASGRNSRRLRADRREPYSPTSPGNPGPHHRTQSGLRLRQFAAVLFAGTVGLLASAADIPAAFARDIPPGYGVMHPDLAPTRATFHAASSIAGWQVALIVLCAAVIAAGVSLLVAQARACRPASTHRPPEPFAVPVRKSEAHPLRRRETTMVIDPEISRELAHDRQREMLAHACARQPAA